LQALTIPRGLHDHSHSILFDVHVAAKIDGFDINIMTQEVGDLVAATITEPIQTQV
jgi:hypothetical protein